MASRESAAKKLKIKDLPKIDVDVYSMIVLNNLVVYAVYYLQEHEVTATVEEIVSICFRLFPQSFALKNYPRWPDSAMVTRRLNEGKEKGHLKGNSTEGFLLKYEGKQLAQRVAKILGLIKPAPAKIKKEAAPVKSETIFVKPVKVKEEGPRIISKEKKIIEPVVKNKTPKKQLTKSLKKAAPSSTRPSSQVIKAKQGTLPLIKVEEKPQEKKAKLRASVPVKKAPIRKTSQKQRAIIIAQSEQLTMALPIPQEKKVKSVSKKKRKDNAPQTKKNIYTDKIAAPAIPSHISKDEKIKAGKFVRLMERSDAYVQYKKNGKNSKIGEFDFRSLLLCTMESSRETLAKNMGLFKGYAGIHNRQDLLIFLGYCEKKFSYLLAVPQKQLKKPIKKPINARKELHGK